MSIISFTLSGLYVIDNLFYSFSLFIIGLVFIWGVFKNKNIWYHSSAHLIVGSIMASVLAAYEVIYFLSNLLVLAIEGGEFLMFEYPIIIYGFISYVLFKSEMKVLKDKKNQIN
jgi:multisubunit Na+/H+ antiporter MnhE subunit